jgi:ElaB/YqjD/DUF883 family membrane-anchored ribosome-binding protein
METTFNTSAAQDAARKAATAGQKIGGDLKNDFDHVVNKSKEAAKDLGDKLRGAAEDAAVSGREIGQEALDRGKRRLSRAADSVTQYADDNTAIVAIGAFFAGALLGYLVSRR